MNRWKRLTQEDKNIYLQRDKGNIDYAVILHDGNKKFQIKTYETEKKYTYCDTINCGRDSLSLFKPKWYFKLTPFALPNRNDTHDCKSPYCQDCFFDRLRCINLLYMFKNDLDVNAALNGFNNGFFLDEPRIIKGLI